MKKVNLIIILLLGILIVIALFTLFYFFSSTSEEKVSTVEETKEFGEFSSYRSDKWKFELKYLSSWKEFLINDDLEIFSIGFSEFPELIEDVFTGGILVQA